MCEKISKTRTCPSQDKNIPTCQKSARGLLVSSINSVHINIYSRFRLIESLLDHGRLTRLSGEANYPKMLF